MDITFYKRSKEIPGNNAAFVEQVKIYDDNGKTLIDYHFFRHTPFLCDGYKHEMDTYLNQKGWQTGMMNLTYKDAIGLDEIIYCISYKKAYEKIYHSVVKGHTLKDIPMKIKEFLDLVDEETEKIMKLYESVRVGNIDGLMNILKTEGFAEL